MVEKLFALSELETPLEGWYTRARDGPWWANVHAYAEEMKSGATFPPILVGLYEGRYIIVDGYHRFEAFKKLGLDHIKGNLKKYSSKSELLRDAVKANNHHGIRYTPQDKAHIAKLLSENGLLDVEISQLVGVPVEKLINFTIRTSLNGKPLKGPLNRLVEQGKITREDAEEVDQSRMSTMTLDDVLVQLLGYLEFRAYPWSDAKYMGYAKRIVELIQPNLK